MLTWHDSLAAVNFFLAGVGIVQLSRIFVDQQSLKNQSAKVDAATDVTEEEKADAKKVAN
jgi:hypothetical protein